MSVARLARSAGRVSLGSAGVRAVHRLVPERRHPPPAEDAGARVARRMRRARRPAQAAAAKRRYNLVVPRSALPGVRPPHQRAGEHPARQLARAARQVRRAARRAHQRQATRWSSCSPASARRMRAWRFGFDARRARRRALHLVHHRARLHRPRHQLPARRPHAAAACGRACSSTWRAPSCRCADAVIGAVAGYLVAVARLLGLQAATGKEGMGYGDFKLLAALGAWLGWKMLPLVILLSSVVGLALRRAADVRRARQVGRRLPLPFRPLPRRRRHDRAVLGRARSCAGTCDLL